MHTQKQSSLSYLTGEPKEPNKEHLHYVESIRTNDEHDDDVCHAFRSSKKAPAGGRWYECIRTVHFQDTGRRGNAIARLTRTHRESTTPMSCVIRSVLAFGGARLGLLLLLSPATGGIPD
jgi:hypothetical protein